MENPDAAPPKLVWPKYLLGAVLLGLVLAVFAVIKEARRIKDAKGQDPLWQPRDANPPAQSE